jgi:hypothetical protein
VVRLILLLTKCQSGSQDVSYAPSRSCERPESHAKHQVLRRDGKQHRLNAIMEAGHPNVWDTVRLFEDLRILQRRTASGRRQAKSGSDWAASLSVRWPLPPCRTPSWGGTDDLSLANSMDRMRVDCWSSGESG